MTIPKHPLLIVDDDATNRDLLGRRLQRCGYSVAMASSGKAALEYLEVNTAAAVLLDVQMPEMSGIEVLQAIRARWADAQLPVVMVTAKGQSEDISTALDLGASDYITKPIDFQVGLARIRTQLARKDAEDRLRSSEERYALAAQGANDGLWDWDLATGILYYSPRWKAIVGHGEDEVGDGPDEWFGRVHSEDLPRIHRELEEHFAGRTDHFESEHRIRHKSGNFRWVLTRGIAIRDANGKAIRMAGSQSDVTEGKIVDALTGLPNRVLLVDRLQRMLSGRRPPVGGHLAVLFIDLDGFKLVNDGLGHLFGDQLLQAVAQRLRHCLRSTDAVTRTTGPSPSEVATDHTIGRLGGDEFVVLLHRVADVVEATKVAARLQDALSAPFQIEDREVFTGASIGIALDSAHSSRADDLLRDADTAMYRAKALGKGRAEVFDALMRQQVVERIELETGLRLAVEKHEFVPFFQPIVNLRTGRLSGFEALLRWQRPGQGIVLPGTFIHVLEENGIIVPVGRQFFADICDRLRLWTRDIAGAGDLAINVNFAGTQFNDVGLLEGLLELLDDSGLRPEQLVVEITESTAISDFEHAVEVLTRIRAAGFRVVLDDFGTGYSSLSCLHELPITGLKLDRSFVARELTSPSVLKAIVMLSAQLGLSVTAEGIETEEQCEQLRAMGCDYGQGYLFGRPADTETAAGLIGRPTLWVPGRGSDGGLRQPA